MSKRNDKLLVLNILYALNKISNYTHGLSYRNFVGDSKTVDAVTRNIGMRNIIVHEHFGIDTKIIWKIVTEQIESLKDAFEKSTEELN